MNALTDGLTDQGRTIALVVSAALAFLIVALIVWRFSKSDQKDRWVDRIATVLVLAWTSEGMWEVATHALHLPTEFVVAVFFVAEALMVSSAMRASAHRARKGVPGPAGSLVWGLAATFGFIVALNAAFDAGSVFSAVIAFMLRMALPLAAASLWWQGITAERDSDTPEMLKAQTEAGEESRWVITPRTLLVRWGLLKPGNITITQAQRKLHIDRMVAARLKIHDGGQGVARARAKLRRISSTATRDMIAEAQAQVHQAHHVEHLTSAGGTPEPLVSAPLGTGAENPSASIFGTSAAPVLGTAPEHPPEPSRNRSPNGAGTPAGTGSGTPIADRVAAVLNTPAPRTVGTGSGRSAPHLTSDGTPDLGDEDLDMLAVLQDPTRVPREGDGTVPTKRAMRVLRIGRPRAIKLLDTLGLRTFPDDGDTGSDTPDRRGSDTGSGDDQERLQNPSPEPLNGINGTHLVSVN